MHSATLACMDRVDSLLAQVLHRRGLQSQATASLVVHQAQEWLQRTLPRFSTDLRAKQLKDGTLIVEAANSIAAQEGQQQLPLLKAYLQEECGHKTLEMVQLVRER